MLDSFEPTARLLRLLATGWSLPAMANFVFQSACSSVEGGMDVRAAVSRAKDELQHIFADEKMENLGLEEVEYDDAAKTWAVTLGFSRRWSVPEGVLAALGPRLGPREYKVVRISDTTGQLVSVKNRETSDAG